jgi:hypothetical protein
MRVAESFSSRCYGVFLSSSSPLSPSTDTKTGERKKRSRRKSADTGQFSCLSYEWVNQRKLAARRNFFSDDSDTIFLPHSTHQTKLEATDMTGNIKIAKAFTESEIKARSAIRGLIHRKSSIFIIVSTGATGRKRSVVKRFNVSLGRV